MNTSTSPPYDYAEFSRRAGRLRQQRRNRQRWSRGGVAVSIVLLAALASWARWAPQRPVIEAAIRYAPAADARALAALPADPAAVSVGMQWSVTALEDQIAWVDDLLSEAQVQGDTLASVHRLRDTREQLIASLVRVRYAERLATESR